MRNCPVVGMLVKATGPGVIPEHQGILLEVKAVDPEGPSVLDVQCQSPEGVSVWYAHEALHIVHVCRNKLCRKDISLRLSEEGCCGPRCIDAIYGTVSHV